MRYYYFTLILALANGISVAEDDCIKGPSYMYTGTRSTTESGRTCQRWDTNEPHEVTQLPQDGGLHNYCRSPDRDSRGTWCYTTDPDRRWEYCRIPKCDESIYAAWTSYNTTDNSTSFQFVKADPELAVQDEAGRNDELVGKTFPDTQLKALSASKSGKALFFSDVTNNYIGILNLKTQQVRKYLAGGASDIYAIAQDFVTGNIYYTDSKTKSVMVADKKFRATLSIYNSSPFQPQAIAVLQRERKLVFSTYAKINTEIRGAKIITTDLSGRNVKVLYESPDVVDVTGLAVDGERIYWADDLGYASKIMSCLFDGTLKKEHYFKKKASFEDIAVHSEYIYATDSKIRYNYFDDVRYHVDVVVKDSDQVFTYTKENQPRGITILRKIENSELPAEIDSSLIKCQKKCGGVCLPNRNGFQRCKCSIGFRPMKGSCVPRKTRAEIVDGQLIEKEGKQPPSHVLY